MQSQSSLEKAVESAKDELAQGQIHVTEAERIHIETNESLARAKQALDQNDDDADDVVGRLGSELGKSTARSNMAARRLKEAQEAVSRLERNLTDAQEKLRVYMASKFGMRMAAARDAFRSKMTDLLTFLAEIKRLADESAKASGLQPDALMKLHSAHALQGIDLSAISTIGSPENVQALAFGLFQSIAGENEVTLKAMLAAAESPDEPVLLALQNIDPIPVLRERCRSKSQSTREAWFASVEAQLETLAGQVADEVEGIVDPEERAAVKADRVRQRRNAGLPFDSFETSWVSECSMGSRLTHEYRTDLTSRYDHLRELYARECGYRDARHPAAVASPIASMPRGARRFTGDGQPVCVQ